MLLLHLLLPLAASVCTDTVGCFGQSCDYFHASGTWTCAELETAAYGCDCSGCDCYTYDAGSCEDTCSGFDCDFWTQYYSYPSPFSCSEVESSFNCDCSTCNSCSAGDETSSPSDDTLSSQDNGAGTVTAGTVTVPCHTCLDNLYEGKCGIFGTEVGNKWKDWAVPGFELAGCQKDTCCASDKDDCCEPNVGAIVGLVIALVVVVAGCIGVCYFFGCKQRKQETGKPPSPPSMPPPSAPPPLAPITLGGVEVDVSQEEVCSPRRVNMVYAPLATWYNTTGKGAALRAKHGPLPANPDAFNHWPSMKEVTMAFLDDAGVPSAF